MLAADDTFTCVTVIRRLEPVMFTTLVAGLYLCLTYVELIFIVCGRDSYLRK